MCAFTACADGYWGTGCSQLCNCKDATSICNATFGCEECLPGWTGGNCDQDKDECLEVRLITRVIVTHKECLLGWAGGNCDQDKDECLEVRLITRVIVTHKECLSGWTGGNCDQDKDECLEVRLITRVIVTHKEYLSGWTGGNCDQAKDECREVRLITRVLVTHKVLSMSIYIVLHDVMSSAIKNGIALLCMHAKELIKTARADCSQGSLVNYSLIALNVLKC